MLPVVSSPMTVPAIFKSWFSQVQEGPLRTRVPRGIAGHFVCLNRPWYFNEGSSNNIALSVTSSYEENGKTHPSILNHWFIDEFILNCFIYDFTKIKTSAWDHNLLKPNLPWWESYTIKLSIILFEDLIILLVEVMDYTKYNQMKESKY